MYLSRTVSNLLNGERGGGIEFSGLNSDDIVTIGHLDGRIVVNNSSAATIYGRFTVDGRLQVHGNLSKTVFLGFKVRIGSNSSPDILVDDNQDLIISDFYSEQTGDHLHALKGDGEGTVILLFRGKNFIHMLVIPSR